MRKIKNHAVNPSFVYTKAGRAIRRKFIRLFGLRAITPAVSANLRLLVNLIHKNGDTERVDFLVDCYRFDVGRTWRLGYFYFAYKDRRVSVNAEKLWSSYFTKIDLLVDPLYFACISDIFFARLKSWIGNSATDFDFVLDTYLSIVCRHRLAKKIKKTPKGLFGNFGWELFEEGIGRLGGKAFYLKPSERKLKSELEIRRKLGILQAARLRLLADGLLREYDDLGKKMSELGIIKTYIFYTGQSGG